MSSGYAKFRNFSNRKDLSFEEIERRAMEIAQSIDTVKHFFTLNVGYHNAVVIPHKP